MRGLLQNLKLRKAEERNSALLYRCFVVPRFSIIICNSSQLLPHLPALIVCDQQESPVQAQMGLPSVPLWRHMSGKMVLFIANAFSFVSLIYEGCNQAVMGNVSAQPDFVNRMGLGVDGVVDQPIKQG
jgi:hypothetical protein